MTRIDFEPDDPADVAALDRLHRAGWSVGDFAAHTLDGRPVWVVAGSNGENLIRAEGSTSAEAWARAVEQARLLGILGRSVE